MSDAPHPATPRPPTVRVYGAKPAPEPRGASPLLAGIIAGFVAAVLWALLVYLTHYEFGSAAWGVGALVGVAVAKSTRARRSGSPRRCSPAWP